MSDVLPHDISHIETHCSCWRKIAVFPIARILLPGVERPKGLWDRFDCIRFQVHLCSSSTLCPYIMFDGVYNCFTSRGIKAWLLLHCMNISGAHQLWWIGPSLFYACILNHYIVTYIVRENSLGRTKGRYWAVKLRSHSPKNTTVTSALPVHWRLLLYV